MIERICQCTGLTGEEIKKMLFERNLRDLYETGKINSLELHSLFQEASPRLFSFDEFMHALSDIFTPNHEIWPIVHSLKKEGIRLVLLSNTSECHFKRINTDYPICQVFDQLILSYEVGACKPDLLIYQKALEAANCSKDECFYTDDIPEFIAGASKAGLKGEIYTDPFSLRKHLIDRGCDFLRKI